MSADANPPFGGSTPYWNIYRIIGTFAACAFVGVFGWKTINATILVDLKAFGFSDFLSLLLAFFSISLSLVFYLKASETSNTFYDNTYKFTANVSEILGRIEAGFSERLRHLDEGYSRLGDRFDKIPFNFVKAEQQIVKEQEVVDEKEKERDRLLDELLAKARLQDNEKAQYLERLHATESQLAQAKEEVLLLRRRQQRAETDSEGTVSDRAFRILRNVARRAIAREIAITQTDRLSELVRREITQHPPRFIFHLQTQGLLDKELNLTAEGVSLLSQYMSRDAA
jgi:hypothetical protein